MNFEEIFLNTLTILPFLIYLDFKIFTELREIREFWKQIFKDILMGMPIVFLLIWLALR
jgi:hypothetical protein